MNVNELLRDGIECLGYGFFKHPAYISNYFNVYFIEQNILESGYCKVAVMHSGVLF